MNVKISELLDDEIHRIAHIETIQTQYNSADKEETAKTRLFNSDEQLSGINPINWDDQSEHMNGFGDHRSIELIDFTADEKVSTWINDFGKILQINPGSQLSEKIQSLYQ